MLILLFRYFSGDLKPEKRHDIYDSKVKVGMIVSLILKVVPNLEPAIYGFPKLEILKLNCAQLKEILNA